MAFDLQQWNELRYLDLSEEGWENALLIALEERDVPAQRQVEYELRYKGRFRQYLRLLSLNLGLVANFHAPSLEIETVRI